MKVTHLPRPPVPLVMPVGLLFEDTRVSKPDAMGAARGRVNDNIKSEHLSEKVSKFW